MSEGLDHSVSLEPQLREHDFDGIRELDNRLPNWWLWTFYLACIYSVFYWMHFHVLRTGALPAGEYLAEMEAAEARANEGAPAVEVTEEYLNEQSQNMISVQRGAAIFATNCVACHGPDGGGKNAGVALPGPNLTDDHWLHGGSAMDIYKIVTKGVVQKGMTPWEPVIGPTACRQVVSYVLTLRNTDVAGGKPPQGEPFKQQ